MVLLTIIALLALAYMVKLQSQLDDLVATQSNERSDWNVQPRSKVKDSIGESFHPDLRGTRQLQQTISKGDGPLPREDIEHPVQDVWGPQQLSSPPAYEERLNERVSLLVESFVRPATESLADFLHLQCWAGERGWSVVQPWLHGSRLQTPLTYSNEQGVGYIEMSKLYDMSHWNTYAPEKGMAELISVSQFLSKGPWRAIVVSSRGSDNCINRLGAYSALGLTVVDQICINDTQLSIESLERIADAVVPLSQDGNVVVIIREWMTNRISSSSQLINHCEKLSKDIGTMRPSSEIMNDAQRYIDLHLNGTKYVSVVLDAKTTHTAACFQQIHKYLEILRVRGNSADTVVITGGQEYKEEPSSQELHQLVHAFQNLTDTGSWTEVASINNPEYIALMQQTVAYRAHCVLFASSGRYQEYIGQRYRQDHQQHGLHSCLAMVKECFERY